MTAERILAAAKASVCLDGKQYDFSPSDAKKEVGGINFEIKTETYENALDYTLFLVNRAKDKSPLVTGLCGLDLTIPCSKEEKVIRHGLRGDDCSSDSFLPVENTVGVGETVSFAPCGGRSSSSTAFPFFDFEVGNARFAVAVGWSGQWKCTVCRDQGNVRITVGQEYCRFRLDPEETARSVRVLLYAAEENTADLRYGFRETIRKHCSPYALLGDKLDCPVASQTFDRYYWSNTDNYQTGDTQKRLAKIAGKVGQYNTYWVDAMWFKNAFPSGVGNYCFADGFPEGLAPLADVIHENKMRFMVWFEPERIDIGSDTYAAHGDGDGWLLNCKNSDRNRLLNLGNKDTLKWITDTVIKFIADNKIDIYREDFNIDPLSYWLENDGEDRVGLTEMHFVEGLYAFWDAIRAAYPGILIDNCASGGRRIDLETTERSIPCWYSDIGCIVESWDHRLTIWQQVQFTCLSRYLPYFQSATWNGTAYDMRTVMTEGAALAFPLMDADFDTEKAAASIAEIYRFRRYRHGKFIELTEPNLRGDVWFAYQLDCGNEGCAFAFRREKSPDPDFTLRISGVPEGAKVKMKITDEKRRETEVISDDGSVLLHTDAARSSFAIEYQIVR